MEAPALRVDAPPDGAVKSGDKVPAPRQVAIGILVVNEPTWRIKANLLAREVLRAYFASEHVPMMSPPASQPATTPGTKHRRHRDS